VENNVLVISEDDVKQLLTMEDTIKTVEDVLREKALKRVQMPPKTYIYFQEYHGDFRSMPSYIPQLKIAGVKVVNYHPDNPRTYHKPAIMATILLLDPKTGTPLAIVGGATITAMRTGAIAGIATKYLGRRDSEILGLIGAGTQARTQLLAISKVLDCQEVRVYDKDYERIQSFIEEVSKRYPFQFVSCDTAEACVGSADVISTVTPATTPIVKNDWIRLGTHINAIGADAPGKEELDPHILKRAKIVVDDLEQTTHGGEINMPLKEGHITVQDVYGELGEIVVGQKVGRSSPTEITIFDSTGLSLQDIATASIVFERAKKQNVGDWINL